MIDAYLEPDDRPEPVRQKVYEIDFTEEEYWEMQGHELEYQLKHCFFRDLKRCND